MRSLVTFGLTQFVPGARYAGHSVLKDHSHSTVSNYSSLIFYEIGAVHTLHVCDYSLNTVALLVRIVKEPQGIDTA